MLRELKARFSDIIDCQHSLQVLRNTRQRQGDTVQVYTERLLGLAEQAWPDDPLSAPLIQSQILDIFIDGLQNSQIARKVLRDAPTSVAQATKIAVDKQNLTKKFDFRNCGYKPVTKLRPQNPSADPRHVEPMEVDTFQGRCYKCNRKGHRATECRRRRVHSIQAKIVFYKCGQSGHGIASCRNLGKPETGRCWQCGSPEHIRASCPAKPGSTTHNRAGQRQ